MGLYSYEVAECGAGAAFQAVALAPSHGAEPPIRTLMVDQATLAPALHIHTNHHPLVTTRQRSDDSSTNQLKEGPNHGQGRYHVVVSAVNATFRNMH